MSNANISAVAMIRNWLVIMLFCFSFTANSQEADGMKKMMSVIKSIPSKYMNSKLSVTQTEATDPMYMSILKLDTIAIPKLASLLTDTTHTSIPNTCNGGYLSYAQLAFLLIHDIESFPYTMVIKIQWDVFGNCGVLPDGLLMYLENNPTDFQKKYQTYFNSKERQDNLRKKRKFDRRRKQVSDH